MKKKLGDWTIKETEKIFENDFLEVVNDKIIQPDGEDGEYATINLKPGVCTLVLDDDENVYLTRQFRYALGAESLEVVCGAIEEKDENALEAAKREIQEELGIEAKEWSELGTAETDTSIVRCRGHFFIARDLIFKEPQREAAEVMKTVKISFAEAVEKVLSGEIVHAMSCIIILKARIILNK